eukprot:gene11036-biopygen2953
MDGTPRTSLTRVDAYEHPLACDVDAAQRQLRERHPQPPRPPQRAARRGGRRVRRAELGRGQPALNLLDSFRTHGAAMIAMPWPHRPTPSADPASSGCHHTLSQKCKFGGDSRGQQSRLRPVPPSAANGVEPAPRKEGEGAEGSAPLYTATCPTGQTDPRRSKKGFDSLYALPDSMPESGCLRLRHPGLTFLSEKTERPVLGFWGWRQFPPDTLQYCTKDEVAVPTRHDHMITASWRGTAASCPFRDFVKAVKGERVCRRPNLEKERPRIEEKNTGQAPRSPARPVGHPGKSPGALRAPGFP